MQAIILAAGESSRFYPYNSLGHKSLVTLGGETLLLKTIKSLKRAKVTNIIIVENLQESASKSLSPEDLQGVNIKFVIQEKRTGMGDALLCAARYLENTFVVLSAYHFEVDLYLKKMMDARKSEKDIVLLTEYSTDLSGFGTITKKQGRTVVSEKKEKGEGQKIIGIYLLHKDFISVLHQEKKDHYNFEMALTTYSNKNSLQTVEAKSGTLSLKYPWDLLSVKDYFLKSVKRKISKNALVSATAVISGNVVVEDNATVMDGAVIKGPAYIGRNSYVGTNSIIRGGVCVEEKAVVGGQIEIKNTMLMRGATTHSGFIGDSVVGEKTKIAAGFNSANVRLDRKDIHVTVKGEKVSSRMRSLGVLVGSNCSFGIRVGTMPGVVIGNNVTIGPGTTVMENIEDNCTYYTEIKGIVKKKSKSF